MDVTLTVDRTVATMPQLTTNVPLDVSFDVFYRAQYPGLVAVATALSGSLEDGEDLVQDTMVKALMRWGSLQRFERPGGWCHRVLVNACRSWFRRRRTQASHLARLRRVEPSVAGPSADVMAFWSAVRLLPERPRMVVALYYAGDHTVAEVASILAVPEGTVRSDLSRARDVLATTLEP
jgi:RNA polymerase sigma-70 factor (ECF subfamily)